MSFINPSSIRIPSSFPYTTLDERGTNFSNWAATVEMWLATFNLWNILTGKERPPQPPAKRSDETDIDYAARVLSFDASAEASFFRERQNVTKGLLGMAVHPGEVVHFVGITDPSVIWKTLEEKYLACTGVRYVQLLARVFELPKAQDSTTLASNIKEMTEIRSGFKQIESGEWRCSEYTLIQGLLRTLPDYYSPLVQLILHSSESKLGTLTLESAVNQIRNSEQYYASFGSDNPHANHSAFLVRSNKKPERQKPKDFDASKGDKWEQDWRSTCGHCHRPGHIWANCRKRLGTA